MCGGTEDFTAKLRGRHRRDAKLTDVQADVNRIRNGRARRSLGVTNVIGIGREKKSLGG